MKKKDFTTPEYSLSFLDYVLDEHEKDFKYYLRMQNKPMTEESARLFLEELEVRILLTDERS